MIIDVVMQDRPQLSVANRLMYLPLAKTKIAGIRAKNHVFTEHNPRSSLTDIRS